MDAVEDISTVIMSLLKEGKLDHRNIFQMFDYLLHASAIAKGNIQKEMK